MATRKKNSAARKSAKKFKLQRLTRHDDIPATVGLVKEVRAELVAELRSVHRELGGKISQLDGKLDGKFSELDGKISHLDGKLDGKFGELDGKISHLDGKLDGKFGELDGKISHLDGKLDGKFGELDGKISHLDGKLEGRFCQLDGKIEQVLVSIHRTQALVEEQQGENKIVLDGIKSVMERQDRADEEAKEFRKTLQILVKGKAHASQ